MAAYNHAGDWAQALFAPPDEKNEYNLISIS
ncbi:hypothetical protein KL86PLE_100564 [uncultured Pleomorphomonas sp.]|uniref:Uncharacterized protein n=1 Tax=uncultured Pleomorphomonas sp. TaxID=442121 RepID=A0A212L458_9HYPH|nr:hypothetical protein KL86PLE_100564 [uncultured Pleomorphomonas sp.]